MRINNLKKIKDKTREKAVLMHIHFKELGLTKYSRDEIYSMVDVIGEQVMPFSTFIQGGPSCQGQPFVEIVIRVAL